MSAEQSDDEEEEEEEEKKKKKKKEKRRQFPHMNVLQKRMSRITQRIYRRESLCAFQAMYYWVRYVCLDG